MNQLSQVDAMFILGLLSFGLVFAGWVAYEERAHKLKFWLFITAGVFALPAVLHLYITALLG